eukprot:UN14192
MLVWICDRFDWGQIDDIDYHNMHNRTYDDVAVVPNTHSESWYAKKYRNVIIPNNVP